VCLSAPGRWRADDSSFNVMGTSLPRIEREDHVAQSAQASRGVDRDRCLAMFTAGAIARVMYHESALPAVEVVTYALVDDVIVCSVPLGSGLAAVPDGSVLAVHVDTVDSSGEGISVLVTGKVQHRTDPTEALAGVIPGAKSSGSDGHRYTIAIPVQRLQGHHVALV
jgi:hypothetical protein